MQNRISTIIRDSVTILPETRKWYEEKAPRYTESELNQFFGTLFNGALTLKRIHEQIGIANFTRQIEKQLYAIHDVKKHTGKYRQSRIRPVIDDANKTIRFAFQTRYGTPELDLRSLDFDLQCKTGNGLCDDDIDLVRQFLIEHPIILLKELSTDNSPQHTLRFYKKLSIEVMQARRSGTHLDKLLEDECSELSAEERSLMQIRQAELRQRRARHVSFSIFTEQRDNRAEATQSPPQLEKSRTFTL